MSYKRKIERVFLLFPPIRNFRENILFLISPLGISYIASFIRSEVEVKIMDAAIEGPNQKVTLDKDFELLGTPYSEIMSRIEEFRPDIVGISCLWSTLFPVVRELCRQIKKIDKDILTITGGTHPTFLTEYCLEESSLDMVVLGEGESTMLSIIHHLREGRSLSDIDGLAFRDGDRVIVNQKTRFIENLDSIPFPARDLLPMEQYKRAGMPHSITISGRNSAPIVTSRGCTARCTFCSSSRFWGYRYRFRSPENVLDEIGELVSRWGIEEIQFEDDNITAKRSRAKAIFKGIIDRGYKIKFSFPNGIVLWTLDEELLDLLVAAGCYEMTLAFESGCQDVLRDIVKKPTNLEKARKISRILQSKGIRTRGFYVIGLPGETKQQMLETFKFADETKTDLAYFFVANPLPGTEFYEIAKKRDMLRDDFNFENNTFNRSAYHEKIFPKGELEKMISHQFFKYAIRSFFRNPLLMLKVFFLELLFKRPGKALGYLIKLLSRTRNALYLSDD